MTVTKTIGTGTLGITPDYATINLWDSYLDGLGAFADHQVGRLCWAGSGNELVAAGQVVEGANPGAFTIILEAGDTNGAAGGAFNTNANKLTNALRYNAANGACIRATSGATSAALQFNNTNMTVRNLQIKLDTSSINQVISANTFGHGGKVLDSCIIESDNSGFVGACIEWQDLILRNCAIILRTTTNATTAGMQHGFGASSVINNTIVNTSGTSTRKGFNRDATEATTFRNNVFYGWSVDYNSNTTNLTADHNATNLSSGASGLPGTSNQYDLVGATEFESVTQSSEDLRLKSTSVKCRNNGDATGAPGTDIVGTSRPL